MDSELAREKMWSRIYLIPALTAEEDRDLARRYYADQAREKQLLGGNTSPYNSDKYVTRGKDVRYGGKSTDSGIDTFAQHLRLPRQTCRNRGCDCGWVGEEAGWGALYICKGRKQSNHQKPHTFCSAQALYLRRKLVV